VIGLALPAFTRYRRRPDYPAGEDSADGGDRADVREHPERGSLTGEGLPAIIDAGLA
jgi:hypothetical protein